MSLYDLFIDPLQFEWMIRGLLIAVFLNISLGIIGSFLVLRRMALMGDAVAHAVLPGIVIAFLISNSRASLPLLIGATAVGFATTFLINGIRLKSKVKEDAAMGIVFTSMFALGVVLLNSFASHVDLDPDCVLYGDLLGVPTTTVWIMAGITVLVIAGVVLFFKQLQVTAFDALFATGTGIPATWVHYIFMAILAVVLVTAFEAVGSILVVAMLIAPGATAYLWTDRLPPMLTGAAILGMITGVLGLYSSVWLNCSSAGAMVCVAFILFVISLLVSPRYGVIARNWRRLKLRRRIVIENLLKELVRLDAAEERIPLRDLEKSTKLNRDRLNRGLNRLRRRGLVQRADSSAISLTEKGLLEGRRILRYHRLWEAFLSSEIELPEDHVHRDAEEMEHILTPELEAHLSDYLEDPSEDPHGKPIPPRHE